MDIGYIIGGSILYTIRHSEMYYYYNFNLNLSVKYNPLDVLAELSDCGSIMNAFDKEILHTR